MINVLDESSYRLVVLGDCSVGKTSIVYRFVDARFRTTEAPTTVAAQVERHVIVDGKEVSLHIWDTAGQERFQGLSAIYCRNADVALFVFALTDQISFDNLPTWFQSFCESEGSDSLVYIVGNKVDLLDERVVDVEKAQQWAKNHKAVLFLTSALTGEGIHELFKKIARDLLARGMPAKAVRGELTESFSGKRCC
jgi:small GTP-binding protein